MFDIQNQHSMKTMLHSDPKFDYMSNTLSVIIKDVKTVSIQPAENGGGLKVYADGVSTEGILQHVDIDAAIRYFGEIELLDHIGPEKLRAYLDSL